MIMRLPFFPPVPVGLLLRGLNALLKRETWARERLAAHAGKSLRLVVGEIWSLQASVGSDGLWQPCDAAIVPDVTLSIPADRLRDLPRVWHEQGLSGVAGLTPIQGDAGFARLVSDLAGTLRWDVEDDLSRVVGDVLAVRLVTGARNVVTGTRQTLSRVRDNLGEYLGDESGLAVRSPEFLTWSQRRQHLADRLDGLELRLRRLEQAC
jgi:ubiquinone biosynthesis protein UbiJ